MTGKFVRIWGWLLLLTIVFLNPITVSARSSYLVADFETSDPLTIKHSEDTSVSQVQLQTGVRPGNSRVLKYIARLAGPGAKWAGCHIPVDSESVPAGADEVELYVRGQGRTRGVFVTLTEKDGTRWNTNVRVTKEWSHHRLPFYGFTFFTGPETRRATRPIPANIVSIDPWCGNTFEGSNGFAIDDIRFNDAVGSFSLRLTSQSRIPLQRHTSVTLEAVDETGSRADFTGKVFVDIDNRRMANLPHIIEITSGACSFDLFPRTPGELVLFFYEPYNHTELQVPLQVEMQNVHVNFSLPGFDEEQCIFPEQIIAPRLQLQGGNEMPLSLHATVRDRQGRRIISRFYSVPELTSGSGKFKMPAPGQYTMEIKALKEPISSFNYVPDNLSYREDGKTSPPAMLPDDVTTDTVFGAIVMLEDLPSTATIVGQDEFPLWVMTVSPRENALYRSPFGISSGALFHLSSEDIPTTGDRRLSWHKRLGSFWGREDLWWSKVEPSPTTYHWSTADELYHRYKTKYMNPLPILCYEAAWSPDKPPTTEEEREQWRQFVRMVFTRYDGKAKAYELWNEPNTARFWKPEPDAMAYRELMKVTYEELQTTAIQGIRPKLAVGATAGYDPVFLTEILSDGYEKYCGTVSIHPYPDQHSASPEANALPEIIDDLRYRIRKMKLDKELWLTEIGWPSSVTGVSEEMQANYLVRAYTIAIEKNMHKVFWFNLLDWKSFPWQGEWDSHLGLLDNHYRPKPAAVAYNLMNNMLNMVKPRKVTRQGLASIHTFELLQSSTKWPGRLHVVWTENPGEVEDIELSVVAKGGLYVFDYLGAERNPELVSEESSQPEAEKGHEHEDHEGHDHDEHEHEGHDHDNDQLTTATADADHAGDVRVEDGETSKPVAGEQEADSDRDTSADDVPTTRTYRFHVTHEPLYVWEAGAPPPRPKRSAHKHVH